VEGVCEATGWRMINHISQMLRNQSEVLPDGSPRGEVARPTVKKTSNSCLGLFRLGSIDRYFGTVGACTDGRVPRGALAKTNKHPLGLLPAFVALGEV
jgi:hypothetical protein